MFLKLMLIECQVTNDNQSLCTQKLFKGERRSAYRLLTYPHHEVYIAIHIPDEEVDKSNVISLNSKMSQTNLFKNFLQIVDGDDNNQYREGYFPFRVLEQCNTHY